jgi:murein DD-endopeptidase MepM/ murein hydrolase activator NlpD
MLRVLVRSIVLCFCLISCSRAESETSPSNAETASSTISALTVEIKPEPQKPVAKEKLASVTIESSLEAAFTGVAGKELGTLLSQVTTRVLVWWIDVSRDLRKGDRIEIVYETRELEEPIVHAVWFQSGKMNRSFSAVRFQRKGDAFARWYDDRGEEIEMRLLDSPIEDYEQVTSLLKDGRGHKGVDFKAPVGAILRAPFDAVVLNRNWGRANGNCLWIKDLKTGVEAKLLHLDSIEKGIGIGTQVKRGQVIARSGNTGRSTAPHLHYQLEQNKRVLDPFKIHKTFRSKLQGDDVDAAKAAFERWQSLRIGAS